MTVQFTHDPFNTITSEKHFQAEVVIEDGYGIQFGPRRYVPQAINATATVTPQQAASGYITCTSTSAVTLTLPTGTLLGAALAAGQGTVFDLTIDNTASSSSGIVTVAVAVNGILSALAAAVGASAGLLTVPVGVTGTGVFRLVFSSATAYTFTRIA